MCWCCLLLLVALGCGTAATPSYRTHATSEPGRVAALAEDRKVDKYRDLPRSHLFCPLSIETMSDGPKISRAGEGGWQEDRVGDRGATVH